MPIGDGTVRQYTVEEADKRGYFNVESILAHKYKFGAWRFLVKWECFPVSSARWEPFECFRLPGGRINAILESYLAENGLESVIGKSAGKR